MPYEYQEYPFELEPEASSARSGGPPRKSTTIDTLDPPGPPKGPVGPLSPHASSVWMRRFAIVLLVGLLIGVGILLMLAYH
jgi:hypothetical protein